MESGEEINKYERLEPVTTFGRHGKEHGYFAWYSADGKRLVVSDGNDCYGSYEPNQVAKGHI